MTLETRHDSIRNVTRIDSASGDGHVTYELRTQDTWITVSGTTARPAVVDGARTDRDTPSAILTAPLRTLGEMLIQAEGAPADLPGFWYELATAVEGVLDARVQVVEVDDDMTESLWGSRIRFTIWAHRYPDGTIRLRTHYGETGRFHRFQKVEITHGLFSERWTLPAVLADLLEITGLLADLERPVGASFEDVASLVDHLSEELDLEPVA